MRRRRRKHQKQLRFPPPSLSSSFVFEIKRAEKIFKTQNSRRRSVREGGGRTNDFPLPSFFLPSSPLPVHVHNTCDLPASSWHRAYLRWEAGVFLFPMWTGGRTY